MTGKINLFHACLIFLEKLYTLIKHALLFKFQVIEVTNNIFPYFIKVQFWGLVSNSNNNYY